MTASPTRPHLGLVGCWVHSPGKVGVDAGDLAGIGYLGVAGTNHEAKLLVLEPDCIVYSGLWSNIDLICRMLATGKNVVTQVGPVYLRDGRRRAQIEAACAAGATSFHAAGINTGFFSDRLCTVGAVATTYRMYSQGAERLRFAQAWGIDPDLETGWGYEDHPKAFYQIEVKGRPSYTVLWEPDGDGMANALYATAATVVNAITSSATPSRASGRPSISRWSRTPAATNRTRLTARLSEPSPRRRPSASPR